MRIPLLPLGLLALPLFLLLPSGAVGAEEKTYFEWQPSSAQFTGEAIGRGYANVGHTLFAIGGRMADGSITDEVQVLEEGSGGTFTRTVARLSQPVAFAGITAHQGKIYVVGGLAPGGVTNRVLALEWRDGTLQETLLPPLPAALLLPGVTTHRSTTRYYLTVVGGAASLDAPAALDTLYELSLTAQADGGATWEPLPSLPQGGRIAPLVQETYNEIVVIGGYATDAAHRLIPTDNTQGFASVARDGQNRPGWKTRATFPIAIARAAYSKTGNSHITLAGGDSAGGTLDEILKGIKPVAALDGVWAFHDVTDTWTRIGTAPEPGAGGILAALSDETCLWIGARTADGQEIPALRMNFLTTTKKISALDWVVIAAYFVAIGVIGFWFARRQKDAEIYALGGRKMPWWATSISMAASHISTISFMAIPALVACMGIVANASAIFLIFTTIFAAYITYPLLRRLKITSTFAYLEQRFGLSLRLIGSFQCIVTQLMGRIGIVVMLPALATSTMTGLSPRISVLAMGLFTTIYSTAGGFEAVIWTDVFQGILMFVGFILIGLLAFMNIQGGWDAFVSFGLEHERFTPFITDFDLALPTIWYAFVGMFIAAMSFASDAGGAQRVLATPLKDVRKFAYMQGVISIGVAALAAFVGLSLFAFFKSEPSFLSPVMKNDQMVPLFLVNKVPAGLAGLLLATLFAAAMANVSATVNICSVLFAEDFYKRFNKEASGKSEMRVMQAASLAAGLLGTGMALWLLSLPMPTLWETFMRIMALLGGGFGGVFILGMFTRRTHELGAVIGVLASCFVAYFLQFSKFDIHWSGLGLLITISCIAVGYGSSLVIPWKREDLAGLTIWDQVPDQVTDEELLARGGSNTAPMIH